MTIASGDGLLLPAFGIDTSGTTAVFRQGDSTFYASSSCARSSQDLGVAAAVIVPDGLVAGPVSVTVFTRVGAENSSPESNPITLMVGGPLSIAGWASTAPTVDGVMAAGEWDSAGRIDLTLSLPGGGATPATLFAMNDSTNVYLALRFQRNVLDPGNSLAFEFDNNNNGVRENGDDVLLVNPAVGFFDEFRTNAPPCPSGSPAAACGFLDTQAGGTSDGAGAFQHNPDGDFSVYEISHGLNTGDAGHDFSLSLESTVGMYLFSRMIRPGGQFPADFGDTTFPVGGFIAFVMTFHP
jgi:hypothetical protein